MMGTAQGISMASVPKKERKNALRNMSKKKNLAK